MMRSLSLVRMAKIYQVYPVPLIDNNPAGSEHCNNVDSKSIQHSIFVSLLGSCATQRAQNVETSVESALIQRLDVK